MGVVKRQSIKTSIVEAIAVFIGLVSMVFIYPLSDQAYGFIQFVFNTAILLVPVLSFGLISSTIKFYPEIRKSKLEQSGFLNFITLISFIPFLFFLGLFVILKNPFLGLLENLGFDDQSFSTYAFPILLLSFLNVHSKVYQAFLSNHGKIAFPSFVYELGLKVYTPILVLLFYFDKISFNQVSYALAGFFGIVLLILIFYAYRNNLISLKLNTYYLKKSRFFRFLNFTFFSSLSELSNILAYRIDLIMVATLLSFEQNGIYAKILIISMVLELPGKILLKTVSPTIALYWNKMILKELDNIYKSSAINMFLAGALMSLLIWFSLEDLFEISSNPASFENGKQIFLYLAIGKLISLSIGLNHAIIAYSPSYRWNLVFIIVMGTINVLLNYTFINQFGIIGAAIATSLSLTIFSMIKLVFVIVKYRIQPLTNSHLKVIFSSLIVIALMVILPDIQSHLMNIGMKCAVVLLVFTGLNYLLKTSEEANEIVDWLVMRLKK